ncbi:MAG TPA: hypothetical protein VNO34_05860 [Actinomycetota bacterium]|nr:hypothetical protein [Actinomycetota bacterium]
MATKVVELGVQRPEPDEIELWDGWFRVPFRLSDSPAPRWREFFEEAVKSLGTPFNRQVFLERGRDQVVVLLDVGDDLRTVAEAVRALVEHTNRTYREAVEEEERQMAAELRRRHELEEGLLQLRRQAEELSL